MTFSAPRARRPAPAAALLALLATLALLLLAGLPATADAEIRPSQSHAAAKLRDPACPSQRFALPVSLDVDEPAGARSGFVSTAAAPAAPRGGPLVRPGADRLPASAALRLPERPPRRV